MGVDRGMCLWSCFVFLGKGQETHEKVEQAMEEEEEEEGRMQELDGDSQANGGDEQQRWEDQTKACPPAKSKVGGCISYGEQERGKKVRLKIVI